MSVVAASASLGVSQAKPLQSDKEIEKSIQALKPNQIEEIAKMVIAQVMRYLDIDVEEIYVEYGLVRQLHKLKLHQYTPTSKFMSTLLPAVIKEIVESLATPANFYKKGMTFSLKNPKNKDGLLDRIQDPSLQDRIWNGLGEIFSPHVESALKKEDKKKAKEKTKEEQIQDKHLQEKYFRERISEEIRKASLWITLKVKEDKRFKLNCYTNIWLNDFNVYHDDGNLKNIEQHAVKSIV